MRRSYGAGPLHLIGHLAFFVLAAYAIAQLAGIRSAGNALVWFVVAVALHDALLWPLYSAADLAGRRALRSQINYVRVPVGLSLGLLAAFISTISGKGSGAYHYVSTFFYHGYLVRWLLITVGLFVVSGIVFVVQRLRQSSGSST